jgi:hypothetical protein
MVTSYATPCTPGCMRTRPPSLSPFRPRSPSPKSKSPRKTFLSLSPPFSVNTTLVRETVSTPHDDSSGNNRLIALQLEELKNQVSFLVHEKQHEISPKLPVPPKMPNYTAPRNDYVEMEIDQLKSEIEWLKRSLPSQSEFRYAPTASYNPSNVIYKEKGRIIEEPSRVFTKPNRTAYQEEITKKSSLSTISFSHAEFFPLKPPMENLTNKLKSQLSKQVLISEELNKSLGILRSKFDKRENELLDQIRSIKRQQISAIAIQPALTKTKYLLDQSTQTETVQISSPHILPVDSPVKSQPAIDIKAPAQTLATPPAVEKSLNFQQQFIQIDAPPLNNNSSPTSPLSNTQLSLPPQFYARSPPPKSGVPVLEGAQKTLEVFFLRSESLTSAISLETAVMTFTMFNHAYTLDFRKDQFISIKLRITRNIKDDFSRPVSLEIVDSIDGKEIAEGFLDIRDCLDPLLDYEQLVNFIQNKERIAQLIVRIRWN